MGVKYQNMLYPPTAQYIPTHVPGYAPNTTYMPTIAYNPNMVYNPSNNQHGNINQHKKSNRAYVNNSISEQTDEN
jgi:hypothetical protein